MVRAVLIMMGIVLVLTNLVCAFHRPFTSSKSSSSAIRKQLIKQKLNDEDESTSAVAGIVGALGVGANIVGDYSLYYLRTTGCNFVPKYGVEGLQFEQGTSFAVILGIFIWSALTKLKTGGGLPAGPAGLLGTAEGLSYLTVIGSIIVVGLNFAEFGGLTKSVCDATEYTKPFSFI
jgi:hypothetical protein